MRAFRGVVDTLHNLNQGGKVITTQHIAKSAWTPKSGLFVTLCGLFRAGGSGAPSRTLLMPTRALGRLTPAHRFSLPTVLLVTLTLALATLALFSASALAAAPEAPNIEAKFVTATKVVLVGFLNPKAPGEPGTYQFLYNASKTECKGATKTPEPPGISLGGKLEEVLAFVEGLTPGTEYTVCLVAENGAAEKATSTPVTFKTAIPPEAPEKEEANPIGGTSATLNGVLNPKNPGDAGTYEFLYKQGEAGCEGGSKAPEPAGASTGSTPEPVSVEVKGLLPTTKYTFCLRAVNSTGPSFGEGEEAVGAPVTFTTLAVAPTVEETFVTNVASTSATLQAKLNAGGADTTYRFEDAVGGSEYAPVRGPGGGSLTGAEGDAGEGIVPVPLEVHVPGLSPSTSYRFRLVASSSVEKAVDGPGATFTTQLSGGGFALPDARQWELVTPPQKQGALFSALIPPLGELHTGAIEASAAGNAFTDVASAPTETEPQGNASRFDSVLSTRGPSGWSSQVIAPPHPHPGPSEPALGEYLFFASDLSRGIVQPLGGFQQLSPEATEPTAYLHTDYVNGNVNEHCEASYKSAASCFQPLVTAANTLKGGFGELDANGECETHANEPCGPRFEAGTPDLSHVVVSSPVQLTSTPIAAASGSEPNLYEWSGGRLQLLSILPGSEAGTRSLSLAGGLQTDARLAARHAISDDGRRVIMEQHGEGLYARDVPKGETVRLDVPQGEGTEASVEPLYMTASSDGSRVFFVDNGRLTPNSGAVHGALEGEPDLYEYNLEAPEGKRLTDLTPKANGESASVALLLGASSDGSYVYFAAEGNLAPGAHPGGCGRPNHPRPGAICNIYVRHAGVTTLIARLSQDDELDWTHRFSLTEQPVRVSPNGRWLAFMSDRNLTGYDTRDAVSGLLDQEVYLYDATTNGLRCASCNPTGARSVGFKQPSGELGIASLVPGWTSVGTADGTYYQSRYLSDSGRLFFDSYEALVPKDVNGTWDVYQYEPEGVPEGAPEGARCRPAAGSGSVVFRPAHTFEVEGSNGEEGAGCVGLISSGTSPEESTFLDASETGGDVFFLTTSKLSSQDSDGAFDVYDAHECTSASPCLTSTVSPPPCDTEASCKAAPTPRPGIFGAPASGTFSGAGNIIPLSLPRARSAHVRAGRLARALRACRKKPKKKRPGCERQARKSYGALRGRKATNERRAK
jgi:hypothetical protein